MELWQIVMLCAGALTLVVILFLIVYKTIKPPMPITLPYMLIFPVIMIGFPAIQGIKTDHFELNLKKAAQMVKDAADTTNLKKMETILEKTNQKDELKLEVIKEISNAYKRAQRPQEAKIYSELVQRQLNQDEFSQNSDTLNTGINQEGTSANKIDNTGTLQTLSADSEK